MNNSISMNPLESYMEMTEMQAAIYDVESMLRQCYRLPETEDEGEWFTCKEVCQSINKKYPEMKSNNSTKIKIGQTLKYLGCPFRHTRNGAVYRLISLAA